MPRFALLLLTGAVLFTTCSTAPIHAQGFRRDGSGRVTVEPYVPQEFRNRSWPKDWEKGFWDRANHEIKAHASAGRYGSTWFENEKRSYASAMISILGGYEEPAVKFLEAPDAAGDWNTHTLGVDFFPSFTLKHQVRKYFFFGDRLDTEYRERMKRAAKIFTERDPLRRPHHSFKGKTVGWDPEAKNSWVDIRSTDNLKLMRETSVYLFAEETGNEETRLLYKDRLTEFVTGLYHTGMGEWDSENYLGHSLAPLLSLYDFAKDDEVRRLAKAGLDFMSLSAAVKYRHGNFNGPTKRDYNHPYPFGGSAAHLFWLYFGETSVTPESFEPDVVHVITSSYRPPIAVVQFARGEIDRPVELWASKPDWAPWERPDAEDPDFYETQYIAKNYSFGTLARGTQNPDVNGFKILTDSIRGADTIIAAPASDPTLLGSPMYKSGLLAGNMSVGQNGNMAIVLTEESDQPYLFLIPKTSTVTRDGGVTFIKNERTTIAIWPINLSDPQADRDLTKTVQTKTKKDRTEPRWPDSQILKATRRGKGHYGFAIEISEDKADRFIAKAQDIKPEVDEVPVRGAAAITAVSGRRVRLQSGRTLGQIKIWRNGKLVEWSSPERKSLFHTIDGDLLDLGWQSGELTLRTKSAEFRCNVTKDGTVTWDE